MKIQVYKDDMGWVMDCLPHSDRLYAPDWEAAYTAAVGHAVMHHPPAVCEPCP